MPAVALDMYMLDLDAASWDLQYDVHPGFSTSIYPVGSIDATRFVFHLGLLLPLVNNHIRLLFNAICDILHSYT